MENQNTSTSSKNRKSSKRMPNQNLLQQQHASNSSNNSRSFDSASFLSSQSVPQPMLVDSTSSKRRVSLTELLNSLPRTNDTHSVLGRSPTNIPIGTVNLKGTYSQPKRVLLPRCNSSGIVTSPCSGLNPLLARASPFGAPRKAGNVAVNTTNQPNVSTSHSNLDVMRTLTSDKYTVSQTSVSCNIINDENIPTRSPTSVSTRRRQVTPLAVTLQTQFVTPVTQRTKHASATVNAKKIPLFTTQNSTYETGESSRMTKRSKRPPLKNPTPVAFNLDDDGQVRKVYDKYVGISEGNCTSSSSSSGRANSKNPIDRNIINEVKHVLDESSDLVKTFRRARDRYTEDNEQNIRIRLIAKRGKDGRQYNLPTANEVAGLIVGDFDSCIEDLDSVLQMRDGPLQRKQQTPLTIYPHYYFNTVTFISPQTEFHADLRISDDEKKNVALFWIEELMRSRGRSLRQFPEMPFPDDRYISQFGNRLIYDETHYNPEELECEYERLYAALTTEQKGVYDTIMTSVETDIFFSFLNLFQTFVKSASREYYGEIK
ncbi:hypothetical protein CTI12_AA282690 [Artemisia annua]|uniref:Uncharacterized protein n=1 Tax=Artemisia annua TaxID=35608 RepID=A0A2U1NCK6_ARTAN|nr:hypothetical protein CTI12_AA282690 [Artemisia annua]